MSDTEKAPESHHVASYWIAMIPPSGRVVIAAMFMFTIWSVFTGFDLGNIMNKYADASLEQNAMQFQAQIELQKMQFEATENSNDKLDALIASVQSVTQRMDDQAERIEQLAGRVAGIETIVGSLARWTCEHERTEAPDYCDSLGL